MKVSIITVVFNGVSTLSCCIDSVLKQDFSEIEYIVVDGGSTDGTRELIESYGHRITRFVSEADRGIYDAMNKGIEMATGDMIGILNADDFYAYDSVITDIVNTSVGSGAGAVYGDLQYVDAVRVSEIRRNWVSGKFKPDSFLIGWMPPHPTFFVRKDLYERYGGYRLDLGSAADYELMLRMIHKERVQIAYIPRVLVKMRAGGVSNSTLSNRWAANRNDREAWKINGLRPRLYTLWLKPMRKIFQFIQM